VQEDRDNGLNTARILCLSRVIHVKLVLSAATRRCWRWISSQMLTRAFHWTCLQIAASTAGVSCNVWTIFLWSEDN